jgi:hypothetical protein
MVQNQANKLLDLSAIDGSGAFRQARQLAEGQKNADFKHHFHRAAPLRQLRQLAESVEFPEKNADFGV